MASGFQWAKIQAMFDAFDVDGSGYLEERDFEALAARWGSLPRVAEGSELASRVEAVIMGWWYLLAEAAGPQRPARIDMTGLMAMVDRLPAMREDVAATADTIFDAVDENGDGRISRAEHQRLIDTWHGRATATGDVFDRLDEDGDGYLERPRFAVLWTQFWISDDPDEPGNAVCGPLAPAA
ncbi:EF-hand domain-containing protein [Streptomyces genisteinicus]|uniref:EF-hand domain-containing protein n=1 Tax=Streptomyces genisteinicus TaxID=2768068 RepID=A0A7H0HLV4_9ACTN|nr:EF-hand domain-containing protein [Streptomyces genisteinicus]QNP61520.1 EF-hand domain-containing protein [Streptomyces genisteinicus]